jgi:uncharacterized coiled-coil protein SlyX
MTKKIFFLMLVCSIVFGCNTVDKKTFDQFVQKQEKKEKEQNEKISVASTKISATEKKQTGLETRIEETERTVTVLSTGAIQAKRDRDSFATQLGLVKDRVSKLESEMLAVMQKADSLEEGISNLFEKVEKSELKLQDVTNFLEKNLGFILSDKGYVLEYNIPSDSLSIRYKYKFYRVIAFWKKGMPENERQLCFIFEKEGKKFRTRIVGSDGYPIIILVNKKTTDEKDFIDFSKNGSYSKHAPIGKSPTQWNNILVKVKILPKALKNMLKKIYEKNVKGAAPMHP